MKDVIVSVLVLLSISLASYMGVRMAIKTTEITHVVTMQVEILEGGDYGYYQDGEFVPACTEPVK